MNFKKNRWVRSVAITLVLGIILYFMGKALVQNWNQVPFEKIKFDYRLLATSYIFVFLYFSVYSLGWKLILNGLGEKIRLKRAMEIIAISQLGRYLPGKIWSIVGRVYLAKDDGIREKNVVISTILETMLLFLSSLLMFIVFFGFFHVHALPFKIYLPIFFILLYLIVIHPAIFTKVVNFCLLRFKREPIECKLKYLQILGLLILYNIVWVFQGIGLYFLIRSFYHIPLGSLLALFGIYAIAWIIGFLSFIVPGGMGVREGVLSYMLKFYLPISIAVIASLLARVWATIGELTFFAIFAKSLKKIHILRP